jgi:hypothetical protein
LRRINIFPAFQEWQRQQEDAGHDVWTDTFLGVDMKQVDDCITIAPPVFYIGCQMGE